MDFLLREQLVHIFKKWGQVGLSLDGAFGNLGPPDSSLRPESEVGTGIFFLTCIIWLKVSCWEWIHRVCYKNRIPPISLSSKKPVWISEITSYEQFPGPASTMSAREYQPAKGVALWLFPESYWQGMSFLGLSQPSESLLLRVWTRAITLIMLLSLF